MRNVRTLTPMTIHTESWTDRILDLDREHMADILGKAGIPFPEERRRKGIEHPSTVVIALVDGHKLNGYVEFRADSDHLEDVYLSSIQIRRGYRHGLTLGILVVECAKALEKRSFNCLRSTVQRNNAPAIRLFTKLGFELISRPGNDPSLDVIGTRQLLHSKLISELKKRLAQNYETG